MKQAINAIETMLSPIEEDFDEMPLLLEQQNAKLDKHNGELEKLGDKLTELGLEGDTSS